MCFLTTRTIFTFGYLIRDMAKVSVPSPDPSGPVEEVSEVLAEKSQLRLSELKQQVTTRNLGNALLTLADRGDVSILPVGECVVIMDETTTEF